MGELNITNSEPKINHFYLKKYGKISLRLCNYWNNYKNARKQGGKVYRNVNFRANK